MTKAEYMFKRVYKEYKAIMGFLVEDELLSQYLEYQRELKDKEVKE